MQFLDTISKMTKDLCSFPRWTIQYHSNPSLCPGQYAEEAEVKWFYEDLLEPSRTNTPKRYPFHYRGLGCKSRKSRNTWSNRQILPWNMEWSRSKTNRLLPRKCTGHSKHPLQQQKRRLYTWASPDGQHRIQPKLEKLYTVSKNKTGSWLWLRSWTPYCQIQT